MGELTPRESQAMESILDNEALTSNLDDAAAQVLLDWGTAYAREIAQRTAGLDDAEALLEEKLQATHRLMRAVNQRFDPAILAEFESDPQARAQADRRLLKHLLEQAAVIEGAQLVKPADEQLIGFAQDELARAGTPQALITTLRRLVEQYLEPPPTPEAAAPVSQKDEPAETEKPAAPSSVLAAEDEASVQAERQPVRWGPWVTRLAHRVRTALERLKK
ncbi:MAG: hypothetical protein DCC55_19305 [Chloroflexi bacterium]|nr:MAG: hypothetical protein DCC55_19305 [Chloroflexota bacterium]